LKTKGTQRQSAREVERGGTAGGGGQDGRPLRTVNQPSYSPRPSMQTTSPVSFWSILSAIKLPVGAAER
jgi:hypothetical protein